jgi:hypothetical protein
MDEQDYGPHALSPPNIFRVVMDGQDYGPHALSPYKTCDQVQLQQNKTYLAKNYIFLYMIPIKMQRFIGPLKCDNGRKFRATNIMVSTVTLDLDQI